MQLEHDLGAPLLARSGRGVHLTPAGKLLFEKAQALLRQLKQVREDVAAEAYVARGELAIGLPPSLRKSLSVPLLQSLNARYPSLFVRTWVATSVALRDMLINGKIDIAVFGVLEPEPILNSEILFRDPMYLVSRHDAARAPKTMSWDRIAELPLILTSAPNSVRRLVDETAAKRGVKINVVAEVNDVPLLIDLVNSGIGHTMLPLSAIRELVNTQQVTAIRVAGLTFAWVVASSKERPLTAAGRLAIDTMRGLCVSAPGSFSNKTD